MNFSPWLDLVEFSREPKFSKTFWGWDIAEAQQRIFTVVYCSMAGWRKKLSSNILSIDGKSHDLGWQFNTLAYNQHFALSLIKATPNSVIALKRNIRILEHSIYIAISTNYALS